MKQWIDFRRMVLWTDKFWFENRKAYLLFLVAIGGLLFVWLGVFLAFRNPNLFSVRTQLGIYTVVLFSSGCISANFLFGDLRDKGKSFVYLLNPASSLEKLLVTIFFGVFVFFAGFNITFYIVDGIMVSLANQEYGTKHEVFNVLRISEYENPFLNDADSVYLLYLYFPVQSFFILGAIYFKRFSLLKTIISMAGIWVTFIAVQIVVTGALPMGGFFASTSTYRVMDMEGYKIIHLPDWLSVSGKVFFKFLTVPLFWVATYFRLKEKQIA